MPDRLFDPRILGHEDAPRLFGDDETAQLFAIGDQATPEDRAAMRVLVERSI